MICKTKEKHIVEEKIIIGMTCVYTGYFFFLLTTKKVN